MKTFRSFLAEGGDTSATTFFHEIITGIFCADPNAEIKTGEDVLAYFENDTIWAVNAGLSKIDHTSLKQSRYFSADQVPDKALMADAKKMAKALTSPDKLGQPRGKPMVMWTGPTNDRSKFGAADIAFNDQGVSLKYGVGQLKNLTVNTFGQAIGVKGNLLLTLMKEQKKAWDDLAIAWMQEMQKALPRDMGQTELVNISKNIKSWDKYQSTKLSPKMIEFFDSKMSKIRNGYSKKHKLAKDLRFLYRKIYENRKWQPQTWHDVRNKHISQIFKGFFDSHDDTIRQNLANLFKKQISVSENDLWYGANGGKEIKLIPGEYQFALGINNLRFDYITAGTGTGYSFTLNAYNGIKNIDVMRIVIMFRWKKGQMFGPPEASSTYKMLVDNYTELFGTE
tara:strand:+ start:59 stop:1243 length:1185 start_codon:yes stop_codon:yes gene_type:complete